MTRDEILRKVPNIPGIYIIKNNINGKCYIGQSFKLKKRLLAHINNYSANRYPDILLYRAFDKYGIDNFSFGLLYVVDFQYNGKEWLKTHLDELEKNYIQEYNSYINGYNQTLGGDVGVLGFKHTEETKKLLSTTTKKLIEEKQKNPENWIKCKDWKTGCTYVAISITDLGEILKVKRTTISKCLHKKQKSLYNRYTFAKYYEDFPTLEKVAVLETELKNIFMANPIIKYKELPKDLVLSKSSFAKYKKKLGFVNTQRSDTKVYKDDFVSYFSNHSKSECVKHFNISEKLFYKYKNKYCI